MTPSEDEDAQQPFLPNVFEIQQINNRVLGFTLQTAPVLTPQRDCQVLAFGTLEALLGNIQKYNEAFATILTSPYIDDSHASTPAMVSLITAGNDIKKIGAYLRCVELLDEKWHSSPGVQLLLNSDTSIDPSYFALKEREKRDDELEKRREELARKKAFYEHTEKVRKEKLNKAILQGIRIMMSYHTRRRETSSSSVSTPPVIAGTKEEAMPDVQMQKASRPTTAENLESDDEPPISAKGIRAKKATPAAPVKPQTKDTSSSSSSSSSSSQQVLYQDVVVEAPSPESLKSVKRKRVAESPKQPKTQPKRARLVDRLVQ